jgi:hypothetical protein
VTCPEWKGGVEFWRELWSIEAFAMKISQLLDENSYCERRRIS